MDARLRGLLLLLLSFFFFAVALPLHAAVIAWDGGGDGTTWSDAANWSGDVVPGGGDHATITFDGTYTVRLTSDVSIAGLTLGGSSGRQTLDASGFRLTLGVDSSLVDVNGALVVGGAPGGNYFVFSIDGPFLVRGRLDWTNGEIYADTYYQPPNGRVVTVDTGGVMRWIGGGEHRISVALDNRGTLRWEGGLVFFNQGYAIASSGTFEIALDTDATFAHGGINTIGPWIFTNTGTVRKTGAGVATVQVELQTIGGSVDVEEGTFLQNYRSRWENATVSVAAGTTLQLAANGTFEAHTVAGTLSGSPAGTFLVSGLPGQYLTTLTADTSIGGTVDIHGTGLQLDYVGLGGIYDPVSDSYSPAPVNIGLMRFVGDREKRIEGAFVNRDTLRWESGRLAYSVTSSFTNESLFEMAIDTTVDFLTSGVNGGRPGPFRNTGTVRKTGRGRVSSTVDFHTIGGLVDVREGALVQEMPSRWENATVAVSAGATLQLAGYLRSHVVAGVLRGDPQGTFFASGLTYSYNTILVADTVMGGRLEIGGTGFQVGDLELGIDQGAPPPVNGGLLRFVGTENQWIRAPFRNEGIVQWEKGTVSATPGILISNAGLLEISADGRAFNGYSFGGVATLSNEAAGTIRKIDTGKATLGLSVVNQGRLAVVGGTLILENTFNNLNEFTSTPDGIIAGTGTLDLSRLTAERLHNDGVTAPGPGDGGEGIGTLTVRGPLSFDRIAFELAGTDSALYDRLIVAQNTPDLSNVIALVSLSGGFQPTWGDWFDVVSGSVANELLDVVDTLANGEFIDTYPGTGVRLTFGGTAGEDATIVVTAPVVAARQGERVEMPITVVAPVAARAAGATEVSVALRFNATLLAPIESTPQGRFEGNERVVDLKIPIGTSGDTTVARFPFRAALGNDSVTTLALEGAVSDVATLTVVSIDGRFTLLDLCREGGARLLNPNGVVTMSKVRSNPHSNDISFDLNLLEVGTTRVMLGDLSGTIVRTLAAEELPRGEQTLRFDVGGIASGRYFLIVQTPTVRLVQPVEVIR